tara:strand:+ start:5443 stop:6177 length:735 start_codon:yes stop_codon:yes gene_type:complete
VSKKIFPAIDIIDGRCVRLLRGEYANETQYNDDPVSQALDFQNSGASWIHVVDLDAARTGASRNLKTIEKIASRLEIPIQVGGGIREFKTAENIYDCGVERLVIGTAAIENPILVEEICSIGRVALAVDLRSGKVAVHGWRTATELTFQEIFEQFEEKDIEAYIVTHIERDGTLEGPDINAYEDLLTLTKKTVIASGGVGSISDLENLSNLFTNGQGISGVIIGRAIYEGKFSLEQAIEAFEKA